MQTSCCWERLACKIAKPMSLHLFTSTIIQSSSLLQQVLIKDFSAAKQRLRPALDPGARRQLARHQLPVAFDRRKWSAQLVPNNRQELVFGLQRLALACYIPQRDDANWLLWVDIVPGASGPEWRRTPIPTPVCPVVPRAVRPTRLEQSHGVAGS